MRLAKYLAHAGVSSRRAAERLIEQGRVQVEGETVRDAAREVGEGTTVSVDGSVLRGPEPRVVYALHKPVGVLSTVRDTHGRPTVVELVGDGRRLYPVGRLDADSSGLILLTNDGELANRLTHPRFEVAKTYRVLVGGGPVGDRELHALRAGIQLSDGRTGPARVRRLKQDSDRGVKRDADRGEVLEVRIHEGRNRQVRRMCEAVGHPVLRLQRVAFGPLSLEGLAVGQHRRLGEQEIARLRDPDLRQSTA